MVKRPSLGRGKDGKIKEKLEMGETMISAGTDLVAHLHMHNSVREIYVVDGLPNM
jgi:hypothetical protein